MLPKNRQPTPPGEVLAEEFLKPLGITQTKLASHLGWTHAKINELIRNKRGITPKAALYLADAFGTSAEFWLNLQINYDLWIAAQEHTTQERIRKVS
jgi:addiction module HigA family antidote